MRIDEPILFWVGCMIFFFMWGVGMQNSALSKQSAAVNTMYLILTIEVDGELGKVKGIKSYLQCVEGAGPEVIQYILYYI